MLPDASSFTNGYDFAHRLTSVSEDLVSDATAYTLDALGNRTQTTVVAAGGVTTRSRSGSFDALGRRLQDTGGAGQVTTCAYDANGNSLTIMFIVVDVSRRRAS